MKVYDAITEVRQALEKNQISAIIENYGLAHRLSGSSYDRSVFRKYFEAGMIKERTILQKISNKLGTKNIESFDDDCVVIHTQNAKNPMDEFEIGLRLPFPYIKDISLRLPYKTSQYWVSLRDESCPISPQVYFTKYSDREVRSAIVLHDGDKVAPQRVKEWRSFFKSLGVKQDKWE